MLPRRRDADRKYIGIDDASPEPYLEDMDEAATAFCELFPAVYLSFCRRHDDAESRQSRLTPQQDAVLHHLAMSGPLTVGEMSRHFARAQSVVSEIVDGMEDKRLLERMRDARDRRRTLVWLTDEAREVLARRRQVLDPARVERAMRAVPSAERKILIEALRALVRAAEPDTKKDRRNR
jgi:DNA-binding MarR family transcriptional regulator